MRSYSFLVLTIAITVPSQAHDGNLRRRTQEVLAPTSTNTQKHAANAGGLDTAGGAGISEQGIESPKKVKSLWEDSLSAETKNLRSGSAAGNPPSLWASSGSSLPAAQSSASQQQASRSLTTARDEGAKGVQAVGSMAITDDSGADSAQKIVPASGQILSDTKSNILPKSSTNSGTDPKRRKFVSYKSSKWEEEWLKRGDSLNDDRTICKTLLGEQIEYVRDYLELLCTSKLGAPHSKWCIIDDGNAPLWYNMGNKDTLELTFERPVPLIVDIPPPETVIPGPQHEHILSKLTYRDEVSGDTYEEYIEPLVGHLRFPLQKCLHPTPITPQYKNHYLSFRGWILPPPPVVRGDHALYFDASASSWESKLGGASPKFVADTWKRHGVILDNVWVFDEDTTSSDFFQDVPADFVDKTIFHQSSVASKVEEHSDEHPYLPQLINEHASENDYVILQADLSTMDGRFKHLAYLDSDENRVDELIWDHKTPGMFVADDLLDTDLTLSQTYEIFVMLRQRGIRAHAMM